MHWKTPTTLVAAYVAGIGFAIGHHLFYQSLNGKHIESTKFNQQINNGVGTTFAFLTRTCLVLAIGMAFVQILWRDLLRKPITVLRIDSLTQLLTSFPEMFNIKTLQKSPILSFLALISWTLPIAIIIPPATLTVSLSKEVFRNYTLLDVPTLDFKSRAFLPVTSTFGRNNQIFTSYQGTNNPLSRLALRVAAQGKVSPVPMPAGNCSYELHFYGPALKCVTTSMIDPDEFNPKADYGRRFSYIAWVPSSSDRVPFDHNNLDRNANEKSTSRLQGDHVEIFTNIGGSRTEAASIYMSMTNLNMTSRPEPTWISWILNCSLFNASYDVAFSSIGGNPTVNATKEFLNGIPFVPEIDITKIPIDAHNIQKVLVESSIVRPFHYYTVMESFGRILIGSIEYRPGSGDFLSGVSSTSILSTNFLDCTTNEVTRTKYGLQDSSSTCFAATAEQLFENITLSLFSNPRFTSTSTANVTLLSYPNVYVYNSGHLTLAYGLAVLFAGICVAVGGISILTSGKSYSYTFSTIMRTTRQQDIDKYIDEKDSDGADPQPARLARAQITLGKANVTVGKPSGSTAGIGSSSVVDDEEEITSPCTGSEAEFVRESIELTPIST